MFLFISPGEFKKCCRRINKLLLCAPQEGAGGGRVWGWGGEGVQDGFFAIVGVVDLLPAAVKTLKAANQLQETWNPNYTSAPGFKRLNLPQSSNLIFCSTSLIK